MIYVELKKEYGEYVNGEFNWKAFGNYMPLSV
jgi:hypothetical protein